VVKQIFWNAIGYGNLCALVNDPKIWPDDEDEEDDDNMIRFEDDEYFSLESVWPPNCRCAWQVLQAVAKLHTACQVRCLARLDNKEGEAVTVGL
jgi:hypothetical protein